MKISFLILFFIYSCTTVVYRENKQDLKEPAFCKNTLQHDIHRNECPR